MRRAFTVISIPMLSLMPTAQGQLRMKNRYVVAPAWLSRTISDTLGKGIVAVSAPDVFLLTDVIASDPNPQLDVDTASSLPVYATAAASDQRVAVRISCHIAGVCLPFYAVVTWPADGVPPALRQKKTDTPTTKSLPMMMRSGEHATLVLESGRTRLEVPVVSLQSGAAGQSIRAVSLDHKHIYSAHIVSATLLQESF